MQLIIILILIVFLNYSNAGNILKPPRVITGGGNKTIKQGSGLTLQCIFSSTPVPYVTWIKDGRVLQAPRNEQFSSYIISNANGNDNGRYICEGRNSEGVGSATFIVIVETIQTQTSANRRTETRPIETTAIATTPAAWEIPRASLQVREPGFYSGNFQPVVYVGQGRPLTLICRVTGGSPQPSRLWYKGAQVIQRGESMYRQQYFTSSDQAIYRCEASNEAGSHSVSVDVRLGAPLAITGAPVSRHYRVGNSLTLRVTLSRQSDFVISWYRVIDNVLIKILQGNGIYFQSNNKRMDIVPLRVEHAGKFSVRAESQGETASSNFSIYMYTVVRTTQPRENTPFAVGSSLELPCDYYGYPGPVVTWYVDNRILDPSASSRFNLSKANTLRVGPLGESEDRVRIECRISERGREWHIVYRLELGVPPEIQTTNCDADLCRGRSVNLNCAAISEVPLTYSWYKLTDPDTRLTTSSKYRLYSDGKLRIVNSDLNDVGTYICRVNNKYSSDSIACRVRATPGARMVSREQRILRTVGTSTSIYCRVYGSLEASITWYKDQNQAIPQGVQISHDVSQLTTESRLSFPTINTHHAGEYTCVVSSCANYLRQTHRLNVRQNIEFTRTQDKFRFCSGRTVVFPCEATGFPVPVINWYFNGQKLVSGQNGFSIDEQNNLIIHNSPANKTGYYMCNASNPFSWRTFRFRALVQDTPLPTFRDREQRQPVLNEEFCLSCLPTRPRVKHAYSWYKQDSNIANSAKYNLSIVWELCITNFQAQDLGIYKCEATNCEGTGETTFTIDSYKGQETIPVFTTTRTEYTVLEGKSVRVLCRASGLPIPSISWHYADGRISNTNHYSLEEFPNLLIYNVSRTLHSGTYKCIASNRMGSRVLPISLTVYQIPKLMRARSQYADLGVTACFDCYLLKGYPVPTVEWTRGGVALENQGRVNINQANNTLCISGVTSSDQGMYRCTVRNSVGRAYIGATLYVRSCGPLRFKTTSLNHTVSVGELIAIQCPILTNLYECQTGLLWRKVTSGTKGAVVTVQENDPNLIGFNLMLRVNLSSTGYYQCLLSNNHGSIAQVHKLLIVSPPWEIPFISSQVYRANSEVHISCPIRGVPQPRYTWTLGNSELIPGTNLIINNDLLTINNAAASNTGLYSCRGRNRYGHREVRFEVTICGEINVQFTGDDEVEERSWVTFTCSLREETVPDSVEFFIGLERLRVANQTNRFSYSMSDSNTAELGIRARQEDSGPISCRINTTCGSSERTISLRVTPADRSKLRVVPTQVTHPGAVSPNCHNQFTLQCPVIGKPRPVYKWFFNDSIIRFNKSPNIVSSRGRKEITVHDPDISDAGRYRCEATNTQGRIRYSYVITVQLPYSLSTIQRHSIFEGQTLHLGCNSTLLANRAWSKNLRKYNIPNPSLSNDLVFDSVERSDRGVYFCCARSGRNVYRYVHEVRVQT